MSRRITVTTGARLHFGLISHRDEALRNFGGVGLMIDAPRFRLAARITDEDRVIADEAYRARIESFLASYRKASPGSHPVPACELELLEAIPPHVGLGSGTQLGMAVTQSLALLAGDRDTDPTTLAARVGRGKRSSIGIHGFARGGFLIDGGKEQGELVGSNVERLEFPSEWRILLITPREAVGLSGKLELDAFRNLPGMKAATIDRLQHIVRETLKTAVVSAHFEKCGEALYEFGRIVGEYFAPVQGGVYADRNMAELVDHLRRKGIRGVGQTSWGPTIFALCESTEHAGSVVRDLADHPIAKICEIQIAAPLNTGAAIDVADR